MWRCFGVAGFRHGFRVSSTRMSFSSLQCRYSGSGETRGEKEEVLFDGQSYKGFDNEEEYEKALDKMERKKLLQQAVGIFVASFVVVTVVLELRDLEPKKSVPQKQKE